MSLGKQVAKGLVWTSLESFGLSGLSLLSLMVFTRCLTPAQFGVSAVALAIVQAAGVPADLLFHDVLIQRREVRPEHANAAFTVSVAAGVLACALCWACAAPIAGLAHEPQLIWVLRWMSLSLLGTGFASVLMAMQRRNLEFRAIALRSLIGRASSAIVATLLALAGTGVWSLVVQQVLLIWLGTLTLWVLTKSSDRPRFEFAWAPVRDMLGFGVVTTTAQWFSMLIPRAFTVLVGSYLGSAAAGLLSLAFRGLDMLRDLLVGAVAHLAAPVYARLRDDREALASAYSRSVQLTAVVTYPVFVGLGCCAEEVIALVFGRQWVMAAPYFVVVALLVVPFFLWLYSYQVFNALGKPGPPAVNLAIEALYVIVAMVVFGRLSVNHAVAVWASRWVLVLPIGMTMLKRVSGMGYFTQLRGAVAPAVAAAAMGLVVVLVKRALLSALPDPVKLAVIAVTGALTYAAAIALLDRALVQELIGFATRALASRRALAAAPQTATGSAATGAAAAATDSSPSTGGRH